MVCLEYTYIYILSAVKKYFIKSFDGLNDSCLFFDAFWPFIQFRYESTDKYQFELAGLVRVV